MIPLRKRTNDTDDVEATQAEKALASLEVRAFVSVNWLGFWTLTLKEIRRFIKIWEQTLVSPLVTTLLFYAVFAVGVGNERLVNNVPFLTFVIPGLVMMVMAQSAFNNGSVSLVLSKIQGNIVDIMMPPLSPMEVALAYVIGGVVRGAIVGVLSIGALAFFIDMHFVSPLHMIYFAVMGSLMLSLVGVITGLLGTRFDHIGAIQNFIVLPATFLSGTFYTVSQLPEKWQIICYLNPFYYMIDGFRFGLIGAADTPIIGGMALLLCVNLVLLHVTYWLFARGTCLRP